MNGIILINKPTDFTSFDVIAKLRGILKIKRLGHAGTLDPMATGVLPVFVGKATRACDMIPNDAKRYQADFKLGIATDTQDITGTAIAEKSSAVTTEQLEEVLRNFWGEIEQIPPMYSAVKINGQRLYKLARKGEEIDRPARKIEIFELNLLGFDEKTQTGILDIHGSKGTYVRTLIHDIGQILNVGGTLTRLARTEAGIFKLADCVSIEQVEELKQNDQLESIIIPTGKLFESYPKIELDEVQTKMFLNGVRLDLNRVTYVEDDGYHRVYGSDNNFLGLASTEKETMELRCKKMF